MKPVTSKGKYLVQDFQKICNSYNHMRFHMELKVLVIKFNMKNRINATPKGMEKKSNQDNKIKDLIKNLESWRWNTKE